MNRHIDIGAVVRLKSGHLVITTLSDQDPMDILVANGLARVDIHGIFFEGDFLKELDWALDEIDRIPGEKAWVSFIALDCPTPEKPE